MKLFKPWGVDLSQTYGLIRVTGKDALTFLQGQLTSDVQQINETRHGLSAYCNLKGRIRALFRIFYFQESYYLQLPLTILTNTLNQLRKYAKFSKVTLDSVDQSWQCFGIGFISAKQLYTAPDMTEKISSSLATLIETHPFLKQIFLNENHIKIPNKGETQTKKDWIILALPDLRFEMVGPSSSLQSIGQYLSQNFDKGDFESWKLFDIHAGIPEIWPETVELLLPHYLNLPALGAVSFTKGCYCGQEIIARMEYRANIKRHLFHAQLKGNFVPLPGTQLQISSGGEDNAGTVITASQYDENIIELLIETADLYTKPPHTLLVQVLHQALPLDIKTT